MFKHKNTSDSVITVFDSKGVRRTLMPGEETTIDVKREGHGVIILDSGYPKTKKKYKESEEI